MVRIAANVSNELSTYNQNPTVGVVLDRQRNLKYLRIENNGKVH